MADPNAGFYRVKPGETLSGIANAFGRAPAQVARWNHLSVTDAVTTGQVLRVAPPAEPSAKAAPRPKAGPASPAVTAPPPLQSSPTPPTSPTKSARFIWPVSGAVKGKYSDSRSRGIVLDGRPGEPVKAAEGGRVVFAGDRIKAYGRLIVLKHDAHLVTAYANNRKLLVTEGAVVTQGQTIAEMGVDASGKGALKFEVRDDGKPVDPLTYLPKPRS
ncbi:peptidoglycan DD-metalloendopeptidase family protein [Paraburkholderia sp. DHOC27]|uniref:peptidoglycan DD-metalloendopeptidase family protein n=1 Tax=Paraburkholderia sp. DHOC27 TaxID=2303330 RepID=UPI00216B26E8|nr:peptidoglycan DD-metalloendopeptidase family protein [Paraburkholderia sp. DHOC27]